jgi:hypothetical protein
MNPPSRRSGCFPPKAVLPRVPVVDHCASVSPSVRAVSTIVRRAVHHCDPLQSTCRLDKSCGYSLTVFVAFWHRDHVPGSRFCSGSSVATAPGWDSRVRPSNLTARDLPLAFAGVVSDWPFPSSRLWSNEMAPGPEPVKRRPGLSPSRFGTHSRRPTYGA